MVTSFFVRAFSFLSFIANRRVLPGHERATFLGPFSRLCVPANNVQIGTY